MEPKRKESPLAALLSVQDLLAGSSLVHDVSIPEAVLWPRSAHLSAAGVVRLRPLTVGALAVIARAARDDAGLVPLLMIREAMAEPAVSLDQVRQMHIGLVHFLVSEINQISGLGREGEAYHEAAASPVGATHLLLAKHFGWTPEQVSQLTPAQVMVYLAGIEKLLAFEAGERSRE
jgi:hypothetical protein